jgi:hypothetical protein
MEIGRPRRIITVDPEPEPVAEPVPAEEEPREPVPAAPGD